ncbi:dephospho-CoA kinase [Anditalea andensis]|uniref:Dephospho-CoA kinase n=1 Tax=Anditalea andensis TaxID=1048983 RepID=A0A074KX97_9BACT|nr:dephospho-CoA kinase [Anditalea andensis]KEO72855.1 dephospho-CoA kinase [Anditalea andensis]
MKTDRPQLIGLTGGIGSGKTTVTKIFAILGIPIYYADERAKWLMAHDYNLVKAITANFGNESYFEDGTLNRIFLGNNVFNDKKKTELINALVHPAVKTDFEAWANRQQSPYIIKEAALLFETGSYRHLDKIINVSSPLKIRIARILFRDMHRSEAQINDIIDKQWSDEEKNKLSDYIIKNVENKLLIPQVLDIHSKLTAHHQ